MCGILFYGTINHIALSHLCHLGEPSVVRHHAGGPEGAASVVPLGGAQPQSGGTSSTETSKTETPHHLEQVADTSKALQSEALYSEPL